MPRARRLARKWSAISSLLRRRRLPWLTSGAPVGGRAPLMLPKPALSEWGTLPLAKSGLGALPGLLTARVGPCATI